MINTISISDDNCLELLVTYEAEITPYHYEEPGNPSTYVKEMVYVELINVEVVIGGKSLEVLNMLNDEQKGFLVNKITNL